MTNKIKLVGSLLLLFTCILILNACANGNSHIHQYEEWKITKVSSCSEPGEESRYCACGDMQTRATAQNDHSYEEWIIVKDSTCAEEGKQERSCSFCGNTQTQAMSKKEHSYGEWTVIKDSTCTETGKQERGCICGKKETQTISNANKVNSHNLLVNEIRNSNVELSYSKLFSTYTEAINHKTECNCELGLNNLLKIMLYGKWEDANNNYFTCHYSYEDYNNTVGNTWYGTNLPTSTISGNTYYHYIEVKDDKLIIGYEDKLTEERTENFIIAFNENKITVFNEINNTTYELFATKGYDKVQKGNAKLAYIYIAKKVFSLKCPESVKITSCYVNYESKTVYATIQATNSFGGTVNTEYKLYESNGSYYITEYDHSSNTNIDLAELNQKLQEYVSTGG